MEMMKMWVLYQSYKQEPRLSRLSHMMPQHRLNMIAEGIFFSILNYCIEVYGNVWGLSIYDEQSRMNTACTKEDNRFS